MLQKWAIHFAIQFVVRQLGKFGKDTDWAKVKADYCARVMALVPGGFFDDEAAAAVEAVLDACAALLSSGSAIEHILTLCSEEKWQPAVEELKALLLAAWTPTPGAELAAHVALFG